MKRRNWRIKIFQAAVFLAVAGIIIGASYFRLRWHKSQQERFVNFSAENEVRVILADGGDFGLEKTKATTVEDFLAEKKIPYGEKDLIFPDRKKKIFAGTRIFILRSKKVAVQVDGQKIENDTFASSVEDFLDEEKIILREEDIVEPERLNALADKMQIKIIRVVIKEEIKNEAIEYKKIEQKDEKLGWRVKKITQNGERGVRTIIYKVAYHDDKEVSRKIVSREVTKEPVPEITTQGTYMKLGKASSGQGTWYAYKGGMFAASRTLPRGSFAKVTNIANGKSVVVQINDYGPFEKNRIIDLDKLAFQKIADLGSGVIGVKVEQVLN